MALETLPELVKFAAEVADKVRPISLKYFRAKCAIDVKADGSPVTVADRECELAIREMLTEAYPSHGILGEELGGNASDRRYAWIVDPIDGTKSFIAGAPTYGTLLALLYEGSAVLGVIDMPALNERWIGAHKQPTTLNGRPVRTSACSALGEATVTIVSPDNFEPNELRSLKHLVDLIRIRRYSSDSYAFGLLASGHVDVVVTAGQQPYDFLPLVNVVEQAGGCISDWKGKKLGLDSDGRILASANHRLHEQGLSAVRT